MAFLGALATTLWIVYLLKQLSGGRAPMRTLNMRKTVFNGGKKFEPQPLDGVNDPKEAGVLLMLGIAECGGIITSGQKQKVLELSERTFQLTPATAAEYYAAASFLLRQTASLEKLVKKMIVVINRHCNPEDKRGLVNMMYQVASSDGASLTKEQENMLTQTAELLNISEANP